MVTTMEFTREPDPSPDSAKILRTTAAELHDGVAQDLFVSSIEIEELTQVPEVPAAISRQLARIASNLHQSSLELRGVLNAMFEGDMERRGETVIERIRPCVDHVLQRCDLTIDIRLEGTGAEPDADAADLIVRAVREGLANVVKHADATEVLIIVRRGNLWWTVMVEDDGLGDATSVRHLVTNSTGQTLGLASLAAEADRLGGRLWMSSAGRLSGVSLSVSVPGHGEGRKR